MKNVTKNQSTSEAITQNTKEIALEKQRADLIRKVTKTIDEIDKVMAEYKAMQAADYYD